MPALSRLLPAAALTGGTALLARRYLTNRKSIDLAGKVVLITGGSRGLGLAMAEEFAAQGSRLAICARNERDLERAARRLRQSGAEVLTVACDVSEQHQVKELVRNVNDHYGQIDVLVNNAGTIMVGPVETQLVADIEEAMNIMFWGTVYPTWEVLPEMVRRNEGRIVNITSIGGKVSVPHLLSYNCAKFAAVGFSEGLHAELAKTGVQVVTISPGLMRTGSYVNALFKGKHRQEYSLFSPLSSLPVTTISAERAARQIVEATRLGKTEMTLSVQAKLLDRAHGLLPGATVDFLGQVNRLLPDAEGASPDDYHLGRESETRVTQSFLTALGRSAAHRYNQYPEDEPTV